MSDQGKEDGCLVFCSQPLGTVPRLASGAYVIAVDGGLKHARRFGLEPAMWVGDGDSATMSQLRGLTCQRLLLPRSKNYTDLEYALGAAGAAYLDGHWTGNLLLLGAQGGRLDHELGNLLVVGRWLETLAEAAGAARCPGVRSVGPSGTWHATVGTMRFRAAKGRIFSTLVFGGSPLLTIKGAKYNLSRRALSHASMGLSNEGLGREVSVRVHPSRGGGGPRAVFVMQP